MQPLTDRERQYLEALSLGKDTTTIAKETGVKPETVANAVWQLRKRYEVESRGDLLWKMFRLGMIATLPCFWSEGKDQPNRWFGE